MARAFAHHVWHVTPDGTCIPPGQRCRQIDDARAIRLRTIRPLRRTRRIRAGKLGARKLNTYPRGLHQPFHTRVERVEPNPRLGKHTRQVERRFGAIEADRASVLVGLQAPHQTRKPGKIALGAHAQAREIRFQAIRLQALCITLPTQGQFVDHALRRMRFKQLPRIGIEGKISRQGTQRRKIEPTRCRTTAHHAIPDRLPTD